MISLEEVEAQARRAACLSRLIAEHDGRPAPILFHCFSNTGWLAYCGLLADLEARRPDVLARVAGAVVDSAPHAAPCPTVFAAGFMTALSRGAAPDPKSRKFRAARAFFQAWLQGPRKRELKSVVRSEARLANYPQLYIYSDDDHVIPPASVESAAATHAAAGRQVSLLRLTNSVHVAHLRHHRAAYLAALDAFLESAGLAAAPAAPAKAAAGLALSAPIVALAPTPDRHGYWLVGSDGGVFSYGDAQFFGSTGGTHLNKPIVGMASTSDGQGYWLVAADGGVFAYGDAAFAGSTGGQQLNKPIVGMAGNGTGGYLLVASDGGVFAFGSASFHGSAGALTLASPVVGIAALANGSGYYMVGADGGVFAYGAAPFLGSAAGSANTNVVGITTGYQGGYVLASANGGVFNYGTNFYGAAGAATAPVVGIAA